MNNTKFISYSQNFEDIILCRALRHIKCGFYIDIGAQDPVNDSVSRAFYELGWRGVHFEPTPIYAQKLRENRPDEQVYAVALSDQDGELIFYQSHNSGVSTGLPANAEVNRRMGMPVEMISVPMRRLSEFSDSFHCSEVHWMKIDVEGMEEQVLKGWDPNRLRPWIIVVESTLPNSRHSNHQSWEHILLSASYEYVFFDGLNRFYVAAEHSEIKEAFSAPANIFDALDGWQLAPFNLFIKDNVTLLNKVHNQASEAEARASEAEARASEAEARASEAEARIINLISSQSSKITAPWRSLNDFVRYHKKRGIRFYCKQSLGRFENFVRRQPVLKKFVLKLLDVFPALRKIIYSPTCHSRENDNTISLSEIDRLIQRVQDSHATQKQQHLKNKISCLHLVIDLTPLRPGGENGGIKPYIFECIPWLRKRFQDGLQITFLTSSISHEEVRSKLLGPDDSIVCVNINSSHHPLEFQGRGDRDFLWRCPPRDILWRLNADLLYCPFGATTYHCPGIPTIATVVDLLHIDYPAAISSAECSHRDAYFKKMSSDADAFQCISDYGVSRLAEVYNIPTERIFRTHLAVTERFKNSAKPELHSATKAFFYPANFWPHKNHLTLLVAYANYVARIGNEAWDLILTGFDSPEARIVLGYSEALGIKSRVRYEGHVTEERLAGIWSSSSALIFPSLHEGFGIPLVEAISHKLPIICGGTTCLQEVAGDAAVFVDASKPMELADAMFRLSTDQALWESLSANATSRFKVFSFDTEMEKLAQKIELLTKDYPTRVTVSGVDEGCRLAREMFFAVSSKGTLHLRTIVKAVGGDARLRLRCGHRFFGSWLLTADHEQIIEVNVFSDGKPFSFEYAPDGEFGSTLQFVTCHSLCVKNPASHFTEEILPQK